MAPSQLWGELQKWEVLQAGAADALESIRGSLSHWVEFTVSSQHLCLVSQQELMGRKPGWVAKAAGTLSTQVVPCLNTCDICPASYSLFVLLGSTFNVG